MIIQFLDSLPQTFSSTHDVNSATGAAMQAALKLLVSTQLFSLINLTLDFYIYRKIQSASIWFDRMRL